MTEIRHLCSEILPSPQTFKTLIVALLCSNGKTPYLKG